MDGASSRASLLDPSLMPQVTARGAAEGHRVWGSTEERAALQTHMEMQKKS